MQWPNASRSVGAVVWALTGRLLPNGAHFVSERGERYGIGSFFAWRRKAQRLPLE